MLSETSEIHELQKRPLTEQQQQLNGAPRDLSEDCRLIVRPPEVRAASHEKVRRVTDCSADGVVRITGMPGCSTGRFE
jgi:hypothetical protein